MFTIKRDYYDQTKEILRKLNGYFYSFSKMYIDTVNGIILIKSTYDNVYFENIPNDVISEIIHASYSVRSIEYTTIKGGLNE